MPIAEGPGIENLFTLIKEDKISEARDLKGLLFSSKREDVIFSLQLLGLRLAKNQNTQMALDCLKYALALTNYESLDTLRIMENICGPQNYKDLFSVVYNYALRAMEEERLEHGLQSFNYCLHLARYDGVVIGEEKNILYQNLLCCYDKISSKFNTNFTQPSRKNSGEKINIAHVLPRLVDEWSPVKLLKTFIKYHDYNKFRIFVYTTEQDVRSPSASFIFNCFKESSEEISGTTQSFLKDYGVPFFFSDSKLPFIDRSLSLTTRMKQDKIDIAIYYGHNMCCIDCLVAYLRPALVQININIGTPMLITALDAVGYGIKEAAAVHLSFWNSSGVSVHYMPSGTEVEKGGRVPEPEEFNIYEKGAIILATCSSQLPTRMSPDFLKTVARLLREFPRTYYLIIGQGKTEQIERFFREQNLMERVRFTGHQKDVPALMNMIDVYLNEFPEGGGLAVFEAMNAAKPVVTLLGRPENIPSRAGADYVGEDFTVKEGNEEGYFQFAARLIKDESLRRQVGLKMLERSRNDFSPKMTTSAYEQLGLGLYKEKMTKYNKE